jgi:hypothetical protein
MLLLPLYDGTNRRKTQTVHFENFIIVELRKIKIKFSSHKFSNTSL